MVRPISIVQFERCYLGALLLGLVNTAVGWRDQMEQATIQASQSGMATGTLQTVALGAVAVSTAISLILWYFTARRGAVVAKWIVVVFFGIGLIGWLLALVRGSVPPGIAGVLAIVVFVLNAIAVAMLFRPDARRWFGETGGDDPEELADRFS